MNDSLGISHANFCFNLLKSTIHTLIVIVLLLFFWWRHSPVCVNLFTKKKLRLLRTRAFDSFFFSLKARDKTYTELRLNRLNCVICVHMDDCNENINEKSNWVNCEKFREQKHINPQQHTTCNNETFQCVLCTTVCWSVVHTQFSYKRKFWV